MTSIALLSHRFGNIGHSFMALGAEAVAREAFGRDVRITHFEQHHPFSIYPAWHWLRLIDRVRHGRLGWLRSYLGRAEVMQKLWQQTLPLDFDLAVACGGPNLVAGAASTPEMRLLLHHFNGGFSHRGVPVLDAAVGSGFPLERIPEQLGPEDAAFYREASELVNEVTVREPEAARLYASLGVQTEVIPCMAIGSGRYFEPMRSEVLRSTTAGAGKVIVNFQAKGSNTDWDQGVDPAAWKLLVQGVIADLRAAGEEIVLLCHSAYEQRLARQLAPELPVHFPQTELEYGRIIATAKVGFVSRIHAAVALAGIGVPSLVVGNDTRIGTTAAFGLPSLATKGIERAAAVAELRGLIARRESERERLRALREAVIARYAEKFTCHSRSKP